MIKIGKYDIKTKANELTFKEFLRIRDWDGIHYAEFLEKLLEIDYDVALKIVDEDLKPKDCIKLDFDLKRPEIFNIAGKKVKVPKNLFKESTQGQVGMLSNIIDKIKIVNDDGKYTIEYNEDFYNAVPEIIAIYIHPLFHQIKFSSEKYKEIIPDIENSKYLEVLGICFFLLTN